MTTPIEEYSLQCPKCKEIYKVKDSSIEHGDYKLIERRKNKTPLGELIKWQCLECGLKRAKAIYDAMKTVYVKCPNCNQIRTMKAHRSLDLAEEDEHGMKLRLCTECW